MSRRAFWLSLILLSASSQLLFAQNFKGKDKVILISPPKDSLTTGEVLDYSVEWLGIPVGTVILRNEGVVKVGGHLCYHLSAESYPNSFIRKLYDLEYKVHSYLDVRTLCSRRFIKIRRINKKFNYVIINFLPEKKRALYKSWGTKEFVNFSKSRGEIKLEPTSIIPDMTQDLLSAFYYLRLLNIKPKGSYPVNIYYNQSNWSMYMQITEGFLREVHKRGSIEAVDVFIASELNDLIMGKNKFSVSLSTDSRHLPIEFKFGTAMGYVHGVLREFPK
ncbi:MAG TPA: DUF3108 domain-containing protein [Candidatus Margulisiibacteriota bacterium]|nr:DUF3108 domain-containing protein [Candidatus Margulisiibacteriota bacterium]